MTQVTIERELLERALAVSQAYVDLVHKQHQGKVMDDATYETFATARDNTIPGLRAALQAAPAQPVNQVLLDATEMANKFGFSWSGIYQHWEVEPHQLKALIAHVQAQARPVDAHGQDTKPVVSQKDAEVRDKPAQGLTDGVAVAVYEAVSAIYFDDNSDFESALWGVVRSLAPDLAELLKTGHGAAFTIATERKDAAIQQGRKAQVPLSLDELQEIFSGTPGFRQWALTKPQIEFARAIEAAHGIQKGQQS